MLVLEARAEIAAEGAAPVEKLLDDLHIVAAVARRAHARLVKGAVDGAGEEAREAVRLACGSAHGEVDRLKRRSDREVKHAGSSDAVGHPPAA